MGTCKIGGMATGVGNIDLKKKIGLGEQNLAEHSCVVMVGCVCTWQEMKGKRFLLGSGCWESMQANLKWDQLAFLHVFQCVIKVAREIECFKEDW